MSNIDTLEFKSIIAYLMKENHADFWKEFPECSWTLRFDVEGDGTITEITLGTPDGPVELYWLFVGGDECFLDEIDVDGAACSIKTGLSEFKRASHAWRGVLSK